MTVQGHMPAHAPRTPLRTWTDRRLYRATQESEHYPQAFGDHVVQCYLAGIRELKSSFGVTS
jgi:hypothetical protein